MLSTSIILLLLSNASSFRREKSILYSRQSLTILFYCSYMIFSNIKFDFLEKGIGLFGGLFHITNITQIFHLFVLILSSVILILTSFYPRKLWLKNYSSIYNIYLTKLKNFQTKIINKMGEQFRIIEYSLILLFIITGATLLMSTSDLVSIFLSIELQSYGLYLLATLYRNSELATSGGLTYFLLGGLSSCFILLGTSLLYSNSGTTNLDSIYIITSISDFSESEMNLLYSYKSYYIYLSLLIMSVGFLFKISAAPFHFWSPDVYDAIPTIVTTFVAIIPKISILIFILELVHYTSSKYIFIYNSWTISLLISSLLSLIIGAVLGLTQFRIKRLYAYSTISHLGFILLALSIHSIESTQAFLFYLMQYSISNLNSFIILISIGYFIYYYVNNNKEDYKKLQDRNNSPIQLISQIKGLYFINPVLSLSLCITLFSFVGVPPLLGFFGKQMILSAALSNGYIFMSLIAILTSVISAVYYLAVIKQIYFDSSDYKINTVLYNNSEPKLFTTLINNNFNEKKVNFTTKNIVLSSSLTTIISLLTLIILLFIIIPQEWLSLTNILSLDLFITND